jgi:hypothetical protein
VDSVGEEIIEEIIIAAYRTEDEDGNTYYVLGGENPCYGK